MTVPLKYPSICMEIFREILKYLGMWSQLDHFDVSINISFNSNSIRKKEKWGFLNLKIIGPVCIIRIVIYEHHLEKNRIVIKTILKNLQTFSPDSYIYASRIVIN